MQIWQQVEDGPWSMREIGPNLSLRVKVGTQEALIHFDAPRDYWDERLRSGARYIDCGVARVPRETLEGLLEKLDASRPALVAEASKMAAVTQAAIEREKSEDGERLGMAEQVSP